MAKDRTEQLGDNVLRLLDGVDLDAKVGLALQLVTVASDGAPHSSLLSVGEVRAASPRRLGLALWASSTTTSNLRRHPWASLLVVVDGMYYDIELAATAHPAGDGTPAGLALFGAEVRCVHRDVVPYADVTSGITYRLREPGSVLERWTHTVEALRMAEESLAR